MLLSGNIFKMSNYKEVLRVHGLNDDDAQKMISDVVFFFLVADQKKTVIKVFFLLQYLNTSAIYIFMLHQSTNMYIVNFFWGLPRPLSYSIFMLY